MAFLPLQVNKHLKLTALCLTLEANFETDTSQKNKPQTVKPKKVTS